MYALSRSMRILAAATVVGAALLALAACTKRDTQSIEDGLWQMFAGHPAPIILKKPEKVYCYDTIGVPDCHSEPQDDFK